MHLLSIAASILVLAALGFFGLVLLARYGSQLLRPLEVWAYGAPLGIVIGSLVILAAACVTGLHVWLTIVVAVAACAGGILLLRQPAETPPMVEGSKGKGARSRRPVDSEEGASKSLLHLRALRGSFGWIAILILGAFAIRWALFWAGGYSQDSSGLWASNIGFWADWALHMGDVSSFAFGENFPPKDPRYAGFSHSYHYLTSVTAAALVQFGVPVTTALTLQSFVLSLFLLLSIYAFAVRLTDDRAVASVTTALFLLGGTLGWVLTVAEMNGQHSVMSVLAGQSWDAARQEAANFRFQNVFFSLIQPQRSFLYGIPLGLLSLTFLLEGIESWRRNAFLAAGLVAGLLPLANLSILLSLALITPVLFLLFPARLWFVFFAVWAVIGLPQLLLQQGGSAGAASAFRIQIGWIASPDYWVWFWLKNLGLLIPLLLIAIWKGDLIAATRRRFLLAFMPLFIVANLFVFQPWDWDNTKILLLWFLASAIFVSSLLVDTWRKHPAFTVRFMITLVMLTMIASGVLANLNQLRGRERQLMLTSEELDFASQVKTSTAPGSLIAVGLQHNHPVPMLSGRPVLMSYPGWLWSHGRDYREREEDLRTIYRIGPEAMQKIEQYKVDYIVVGPNEQSQLGADRGMMASRFQSVVSTANYELFAVQ